MHPADQFEAFAKLLAGGLSEQQVASRFEVSVLTVQRRMTLASLSPRFIALFRADKISMDQLQALAHSPDHAVQIAAWNSLSEYQRSPYMLKQALTEDEVESDTRLAKFVGLDVYMAAGGAVRRDLFGEGQPGAVDVLVNSEEECIAMLAAMLRHGPASSRQGSFDSWLQARVLDYNTRKVSEAKVPKH